MNSILKMLKIPPVESQTRFLIAGAICYLIIFLSLIFLFYPKISNKFVLDEFAEKDFIAPHDINFINTERTDSLKKQARDRIRPIYKQRESDPATNLQNLVEFFNLLDAAHYDENAHVDYYMSFAALPYWEKLAKTGFDENDLYFLIKLDKNELRNLKTTILNIYRSNMGSSTEATNSPVAERFIGEKPEVTTLAEPELNNSSKKILAAFQIAEKEIDEQATEVVRKQAEDTVVPIMETVLKDEVFLHRGERITLRQLDILKALFEPESKKEAGIRIRKILTISCLTLAGFIIFWYFMGLMSRNPLSDPRLYHLFLMQVIITILLGAGVSIWIPGDGLPYLLLIPLVINAWIVTYFISVEASLLSTLFLGIFFAMVFNLSESFMLTSMITSSIASFLIKRDCRHLEIIRGSLLIILIGTLTIIAVPLLYDGQFRNLFQYIQYNFFASIIAPFLMLGLSMIYVLIFNVVTRYHLIELSDINHPLIRQLQRNAPGSYHHSLIVGDIAEIAAESVGANGLLVRVACLYHDIGKTRMPHFYIENQVKGVNPHDRYPASLSRLVVLSHVKDGVQMARKARLPKEIIDAIQQHQGTTLMKYFFRKALAQSEGEPVDEFEYRYEGPIPQYPEMAIIALADSVEGAVRSLEVPTPHRIESMVNAVFEERLLDGQYNDCGLSISELHAIKESLIDTLSGFYHSRIEYPDVKELRSQFEKKKSEESKLETEKGKRSKTTSHEKGGKANG